jgi:hypothetical protein
MYNSFDQMIDPEVVGEIAMVIVGVLAIVVAVAAIFGIVLYVFRSVGLYTLAKRRGIPYPILAWLPVGDAWIAGSLSDQYRGVVRGQNTNRRVVMLALGIFGIVAGVITGMVMGVTMTEVSNALMQARDAEDAMLALVEVLGQGSVGGGFSTLASIAALVSTVFWYMSMYDLYASCAPKNDSLLLVLSILIPVLEPFFVFANRKSDAGMPAAPVVEPVEAPVNPAEF